MIYTVCVTTATITGVTNGATVNPSTVVVCITDDNAYPPPSYIWTNHVRGSQSTGPQFVLTPGTHYKLTCTASNNFDRCIATDYVKFISKLLLYSFIVIFDSVVIDMVHHHHHHHVLY